MKHSVSRVTAAAEAEQKGRTMVEEFLGLLILICCTVASLALPRPSLWFTRLSGGTKTNVGAYSLGQPAVRYVRRMRRTR